MIRKQFRLFLWFIFIGLTPVIAQKSAIYTHEAKDFDRAVGLYKESQYQSAQILFDRVKSETKNTDEQADCAYYIANCAIRLNQSGADELMEDFVRDYPTSPKQNQAYVEVAHYYFDQGKFPQALDWFNKVDESGLSYEEQDKFNFQKGYAYFSAGQKKEATPYFNRVINSKDYSSQANYYLGFMAYEGNDYKQATKYFKEVSGEEKYQDTLKTTEYPFKVTLKAGKDYEITASGPDYPEVKEIWK